MRFRKNWQVVTFLYGERMPVNSWDKYRSNERAVKEAQAREFDVEQDGISRLELYYTVEHV